MFSWITGPRITNAIEDLQPDHGYENTFIDAPETPAHQFAVKALKRAVFGTPAVDDTNNAGKRLQKKQSPDLATSKVPVIAAPKEDAPPVSPSKLPGGILMTPGTANKGRKSVKFGAHVVDNEGRRGNAGRSGMPSDCPGKFPSPWTPGTELKPTADSEQKPRTKLTAALMDARTTTQPRSGQKPKARDDSDITMDLGAPRSDSGKYWKEQYEEYTARSEKEVKKLIAKQQLAKNYAMKKDGEVTELFTKLEQERKRFRRREQELEQQNKDYQERLRQAMAEKLSAGIEITALKNRIATLEKSLTATSSDLQEVKSSSSFQIFEDTGKNSEALRAEQDRLADASYLSQKVRVVSIGKENSPPKPRHVRRQTMPEPSSSVPQASLSVTPRLGVAAGDVSTILGRPPRIAAHEAAPAAISASALKSAEPASTSSLSIRKHNVSQQNPPPKSPAPAAPSSPLPQPSPDPWMMGADESSIAPYDRLALPVGGGSGSHSRPTRPMHTRRHEPSKSISQAPTAERPRRSHRTEESDLFKPIPEALIVKASKSEKPRVATSSTETTQAPAKASEKLTTNARNIEDIKASSTSPTDPKFDISKITGHHAEGSSEEKKERWQTLPVDRKEEARRRLAERKQKKLLAK
ncbi:uncharacterized protein N0V89_005470 [Didymosphaeria variabile]|uniref:Spindle pole body-associated protein cut12 domain-containing protein n=1 Tax=Didymosphaeria variabile TaxID=1932322 RepID=A0A9W8XKU0_9PLEO|nr:uncharacterized protein N0V89_005470 [Didymosphaeria variabile]KAJ4353740.1 hypothetical protein N0V89_005470 [Didymosphaeria variabile]